MHRTPEQTRPALDAAQQYLKRGLVPIRLAFESKKPAGGTHDKNTAGTPEQAQKLFKDGAWNVGLRLGPACGSLVDFDLDWPEARRIGVELLSTLPRFGRDGREPSHYLARCSGLSKTVKFQLPKEAVTAIAGQQAEHAACILELRASGYTVAPPSTYENGQACVWDRDATIPECDAAHLRQRAGLIAFLSVVLRQYPSEGARDDACMALSGALLGAGHAPDDVNKLILMVAEMAGDEEAARRGKASGTAGRMDAGEPATGIPTLVKLLGLPEAMGRFFREWLGITREDARPQVIYAENQLSRVLDEAEDALRASGAPIYQMGGQLVHPLPLDSPVDDDGVRRVAGALIVRPVGSHRMREYLIGAANFVRLKDTKDGTVQVPYAPPVEFANHFLSRGDRWRLPVLRGLTEVPLIRSDGSILSEHGYDRASQLILDAQRTAFPGVADAPSEADARSALDELVDTIKDFPFEDGPSRSVALSAMLAVVCRKTLRTVPLHGFSATERATGKSLLADVVAMLATGRPAVAMSVPEREEELEKRLLSVLMASDAVVLFDNVEQPLASDALCTILTQEAWQSRLLGANKQVRVPTNALFLATGNNLELRGDLSTRAIVARMDAGMEDPGQREFDRDLKVWVPDNRARLIAAALTVLRGYVAAGRPGELRPFGRFEDWSRLVRGALVWLGEADPCDTRSQIVARDPQREVLAELLTAWLHHPRFGLRWRGTASEMLAHSPAETDGGRLSRALEAACPRGATARALGRYLSKVRGRIVDGMRVQGRIDAKHGSRWWLEEVEAERQPELPGV